ncbi:MAG: hypothetical protein ABI589_13985, partial [Burkholderiales bacterium]
CQPSNPPCGRISKISREGQLTVLAGSFDNGSHADGAGAAASFLSPSAIAFDPAGNLLVGEDRPDGAIRKVTPAGVVTTLARNVQANGVAVGPDGTVYATVCAKTFGNFQSIPVTMGVVKIAADGSSSLLAGTSESGAIPSTSILGDADGPGPSARFNCPGGIAVGAGGNLFVADTDNNLVRKITPAGEVSTVVGQRGLYGIAPGPLPGSLLQPFDVNLDAAGDLYIGTPRAILKVRPAD